MTTRDNAVIESWHSTLEFELRSVEHFASRAAARARVSTWIEDYNQNRRHSALGMMSPASYEQPEMPALLRHPGSAGARPCQGRSSLDRASAPAECGSYRKARTGKISQIEVSAFRGTPGVHEPPTPLVVAPVNSSGWKSCCPRVGWVLSWALIRRRGSPGSRVQWASRVPRMAGA